MILDSVPLFQPLPSSSDRMIKHTRQSPFASLPWYDLSELQTQTDRLWECFKGQFRKAGLSHVPDYLNRDVAYDRQWTSRRFFFGQACGYDVRMAYAEHLTTVATPCYDVPGCEGSYYRSYVVVPEDSACRSIDDLRGRRCVINTPTSHSGMNVLRALVAPIHCSGQFFGNVRLSGAHEVSLRMIQQGQADVAAIDCVTHALLSRYRPEELSGTRIIYETDLVPAPPYVTAADVDKSVLDAMQKSVVAAFHDPHLLEMRKALMISGVEILPEDAYGPIESMDGMANSLGYFEICSGLA